MSDAEEVLLEKLEDDLLKVRSYSGVTIGREKFTVAKQKYGRRGEWVSQQGSSHLKADFVQTFRRGNEYGTMQTTRYGILTNVLLVESDSTVLLDVRWYKEGAAEVNDRTKNVYLRLEDTLEAESEPRLIEACSISNQVVFAELPSAPGLTRDAQLKRRKAVILDREFLFMTPLSTVLSPGA